MKILFKTAVLGTMLPLTGGELLNLNSSMELGIVGRGVPGCSYYATMLDKHQIAEFPDRIYSAETAEGGNPGRCMKIPGFRGISRYRIEFADFYANSAIRESTSFSPSNVMISYKSGEFFLPVIATLIYSQTVATLPLNFSGFALYSLLSVA